ncbi:MAG: DUF2059 domain-containing protein [Hyphomonadaceae bacterium]
MVRAFALALALALAAWTPAHAQQQSERQRLAQELVQLMDMEKTLGDFFVTMSPMVASSMATEMRLTPVQTARLGEIVAEEFRAETPVLVGEMAAVYAQRMDEPQLREVVTFLRSPAGVVFMQSQRDAQAELENIGQLGGMRVGVRAITRLLQESQQR